MKTYIYVLKPVARLQSAANWTAAENGIVSQHFAYLQDLQLSGRLILAGKTDGLDENTFGIVIFKSANLEEATKIAEADPAVKDKIMTADLFPYTVALSDLPKSS